ncbi:MAG TPA: hypothetical protein VK892_23205 [Pyrinomonadaceae bacterium]|nr:hypothetical protein [Pyrinomonadaceae bacterium]
MKPEQKNLYQAARIISVLGHPFVLLPFTVFIVAFYELPPARAFTVGIITVFATVVPLLFIIRRKVAAGKWADHDISVPAERRDFYPIVIAVVAISCLVFWFLDFPRPLLIGIFISLILLLAAMFINRRSKISLHLIFITYCAIALTAVSFWVSASLILLAVALGWSRVVLERHSLTQVLSGALLGGFAGFILLKVIALF